MRIAILNYADVLNFGDVLFPIIAEQELRARLEDIEIRFFSPTDHERGEFRSFRYDRDALVSFDAILMCGGEIVHREDEMLRRIYARLGTDSVACPTDIVFDWTRLPIRFKAWIGLGMPLPTPGVARDVASATAGLDLIVARGEGTRARLLASGAPPDRLETAPDIGWLVPRTTAQWEPAAADVTPGRPYLVVHAIPQLESPGSLESAAAVLKVFQDRLGLEVICLPLTCWGDHETLDRLANLARGAFSVVDHRVDVLTKVLVLRNCAFYVGQSMHGFISVLASGRPAGLSYPDLEDKFRELLSYLGVPEWRVDNWHALNGLLDRITNVPATAVLTRQARAVAAVDEMFDSLVRRMTRAVDC